MQVRRRLTLPNNCPRFPPLAAPLAYDESNGQTA